MDFRRSSLLGWLELPVIAPKTSPPETKGLAHQVAFGHCQAWKHENWGRFSFQKSDVAGKTYSTCFIKKMASATKK